MQNTNSSKNVILEKVSFYRFSDSKEKIVEPSIINLTFHPKLVFGNVVEATECISIFKDAVEEFSEKETLIDVDFPENENISVLKKINFIDL